ncbi:nucleotide exchange factor GrpE [Candidatus Saccharibacteria bacterium]|nr:nucleotide exchange factor GrpE [Candidatus Saccharibacteria bacterium]
MSKSPKKLSVAQLEKQVSELTDALQRERADAINVRRRAEQEREKLADFYKAMIVQKLLPAIDNLERALKHAPKDLAKHEYVKGVQSVAEQFEKVFADIGVKRVKSVGEEFDPRYHEAISIEDDGGELELVSEELAPGYRIEDEVIRHAMVRVKKDKK